MWVYVGALNLMWLRFSSLQTYFLPSISARHIVDLLFFSNQDLGSRLVMVTLSPFLPTHPGDLSVSLKVSSDSPTTFPYPKQLPVCRADCQDLSAGSLAPLCLYSAPSFGLRIKCNNSSIVLGSPLLQPVSGILLHSDCVCKPVKRTGCGLKTAVTDFPDAVKPLSGSHGRFVWGGCCSAAWMGRFVPNHARASVPTTQRWIIISFGTLLSSQATRSEVAPDTPPVPEWPSCPRFWHRNVQ